MPKNQSMPKAQPQGNFSKGYPKRAEVGTKGPFGGSFPSKQKAAPSHAKVISSGVPASSQQSYPGGGPTSEDFAKAARGFQFTKRTGKKLLV